MVKPKTASYFLNNYIGRLNSLERTRLKMEQLLIDGCIVRRDIEQVYEGMFISSITLFENWLEKLFIGLLVGRVQLKSSVVPRVTFRSDKVARDVIFGGQNYVDWFPYRYTEKRAEAFFRNGLPFKCLMSPDKKVLENILYIRNAIAHKSSYAVSTFKDEVIGNTPLRPQEQTPAGFLRSRFRITPTQTRYENIVTEIVSIARKLCS